MTDNTVTVSGGVPQHRFLIPASISLVSVLGPNDEYLKVIEDAFEADVHARGNEITVTGDPAEAALVERLVDELVTIVQTGQPLTRDLVERSASMLRTATQVKPAEVL